MFVFVYWLMSNVKFYIIPLNFVGFDAGIVFLELAINRPIRFVVFIEKLEEAKFFSIYMANYSKSMGSCERTITNYAMWKILLSTPIQIL